ncbi:MAG: ferritin-like domain-containing protein [Armatimonadetes bacterium]|nr:ferritin-like domain-containing protein [Akkermansiaceae bacterium]
MSKLTNLEKLLVHEIKDLYSAESQLVKALPKMAKAASNVDLKEAFKAHLVETKTHVERLEKVAELLDTTPRGLTCKAMKGLVEEGAETMEEEGDENIIDLALITAAQKVEHYEIAGYGSAHALATTLKLPEVASLVAATLAEEGAADKKLGMIAASLLKSAPRASQATK